MSNLASGPFGLSMGMRLEDLETTRTSDAGRHRYFCRVPKPHPLFETYMVQISPQSGLARIIAIGSDISTNGFGFELQSAFTQMKRRLEKVYGKCQLLDILLPGSCGDEPGDWLSGLQSGERQLEATWSTSNRSNLKDDIAKVSLVAGADEDEDEDDTGFLVLFYDMMNAKQYDTETESIDDSVL